MGIQRGAFEQTALSGQVARAVEHSTIRPDEGAALRSGAQALNAWSNTFGKMAELAKKIKAKKDANSATQAACKDAANAAAKAFEDYEAKPQNEQNAEKLQELKDASAQATERYNASKTLGVFSGNFDMNKDYVKWEQEEAEKAQKRANTNSIWSQLW